MDDTLLVTYTERKKKVFIMKKGKARVSSDID